MKIEFYSFFINLKQQIKSRIFLFFISIIILSSPNSAHISTQNSNILESVANKTEIKNLLHSYFSKGQEKYQAACFLIKSLPIQASSYTTTYKSQEIDSLIQELSTFFIDSFIRKDSKTTYDTQSYRKIKESHSLQICDSLLNNTFLRHF